MLRYGDFSTFPVPTIQELTGDHYYKWGKPILDSCQHDRTCPYWNISLCSVTNLTFGILQWLEGQIARINTNRGCPVTQY